MTEARGEGISPQRLEGRVRICERYLHDIVDCNIGQYAEIAARLVRTAEDESGYQTTVALLRQAAEEPNYRGDAVNFIRERCGYEVKAKPKGSVPYVANRV